MKPIAKFSLIFGIIAIIVLAASIVTNKIVNDSISAAAISGTQNGQLQGQTSGTEKGKNNGIAEGTKAGIDDGSSKGTLDGISSGKESGENDGSNGGTQAGLKDGGQIGTSDGTRDGAITGNSVGLSTGQSDGYKTGYDNGFTQGTGSGYIIRRPTFLEAMNIAGKFSGTNAANIVNETYSNGIQAGYVLVHFNDSRTLSLIAFNTIDRGIIYFLSTGQLITVEVGKSFFASNGYEKPSYDDKVIRINISW